MSDPGRIARGRPEVALGSFASVQSFSAEGFPTVPSGTEEELEPMIPNPFGTRAKQPDVSDLAHPQVARGNLEPFNELRAETLDQSLYSRWWSNGVVGTTADKQWPGKPGKAFFGVRHVAKKKTNRSPTPR